jgi:hypothetical protein
MSPLYPVINLETKETKELEMSMSDYVEWKKDNPEWDKDWQAGCASVGEVGDWRNKLENKHPDWNHILKKSEKSGGSKAQMGIR